MSIKREYRKIERTPQEQARLETLRTKYERDRPGPDQLLASGKYDGPVRAGAYWEARRIMVALQAERKQQALTLAQLAERSGLDKGAISKLESGRQVNPTVDTLFRIAAGLGLSLGITLRRVTAPNHASRQPEQKTQRRAANKTRRQSLPPTSRRGRQLTAESQAGQ